MKYLRATLRLLALSSFTGVAYLLWLLGQPLVSLFPCVALRWRNWTFRRWACNAVHILGIKIDVLNNAPQSPFVLVSNHLSYLDIVVLASKIDCAFVAKREVAGWPIIGLMCRSMNTVFINRRRKRDLQRAMAKTQKLFERGLGVVLFAEGTSTAGQAVSPFKSSMLDFAARQDVPVHYASISYATCADDPSPAEAVCWWGDMTFPDHLFRLMQLSGIEAKLTFGRHPIVANDRRVLASRLWSAVSAQFIPVTVHR